LPRRRHLLGFAALCVVAACTPSAPKVADHPTAAGVAAIDGARLAGAHPVGLRAADGPDGPLWLFYPASSDASAGSAAPLPPDYVISLARRFGGQAAADLIAARGPVAWDAPPLAGRHPLLIFTPGASMGGQGYRALLAGIASHGYVVAALDPLGSPPVSDQRYADAADALGRAARTLAAQGSLDGVAFDRGCLVAIGHSIGGAAAVLALTRSPVPLVAAINLDGDYSGAAKASAPARPILYVTGSDPTEAERSVRRRAADWALVAGDNPAAHRVELGNLRHLDFHDAALLPAVTIPSGLRHRRFGPLGGARALASIDAEVSAFLKTVTAACAANSQARG